MWLILFLFASCIVVGGGQGWYDGLHADGYQVLATPDKPAIISCSIASKNLTKFTWWKMKKGALVWKDEESSTAHPRWINETHGTMELYFTSVRPEDYGRYRCTAEKNSNYIVHDDFSLVEYQTDRILTVGVLKPESIYIKWELYCMFEMEFTPRDTFSFEIEYRQNGTDGWLRTPRVSSPERFIHAGSFRIDELEPSTVYEIKAVTLTEFYFPVRRIFSRWVTTSDVEYVPTVRIVNKTTDTVTIGWSQPPPELRQSIDAYLISVESSNDKEKHFRWQQFKADEGNEAIVRLSPSISYDLEVRACFGDFCPDRRASDVVRGVTTDDAACGEQLRARPKPQSDIESSVLTINVTRDAENTTAGRNASFTCSVSVQGHEGWWTKQGERITSFNDSESRFNWSIIVGDAGEGNTRDYTCVAKNSKDSHPGGGMLVTVIPPTENIIVGAEVVYGKPGEPTALLCDFFGHRRSNFEWQQVTWDFIPSSDPVPLISNVNKTHVRMMLHFANPSNNDSSVYECRAMNKRLPRIAASVRLEVSNKSPLQLSAFVIGPEFVHLRWFDRESRGDSHLIRYSENGSLEREDLFSVQVEEGRTYNRYFRIQLRRGTFYRFELVVFIAERRLASTYSGLITPADRDLEYFPNITVISKSTNSIAIEWPTPPEELRADIQLYRISINYTYNGTEIVESKNTTETLYFARNLHPSTSHNFEVKACFSGLSTECYWNDVRKEVFTESVDAESRIQVEIWLPLTGISFFLVILEAWRFYKKARKRRILRERLAYFYSENPTSFNPELSMNDQADLLPYEMEWEFPRKLLRLDDKLGSGSFGIVWKARAKTIRRPEAISVVAVKTVRPTASLSCMKVLLRELKILGYLGYHPNIVSLLGACTKNLDYGELLVIVEFCRFGNLHDYLWRCRSKFVDELGTYSREIPDSNSDADPILVESSSILSSSTTNSAPRQEDAILMVEDSSDSTDQPGTRGRTEDSATGSNSHLPEAKPPAKYPGDFRNAELDPVRTRDLVSWAWQISRGMQYLAAKKVLHGDLAARNVLLLEDNVVKICDFGLSKSLLEDDQYKDEGNDPLPVKWMAIESLRDGIFSVKSDVWSFGVFLWELFSLAKTPCPEINPRDMCETLVGGYRMERPKYSPETIYRTMLQCWEANPSKRPTFVQLEHSIGNLMEENVKMHYIQLYTRREKAYARITEFRNKRDPENQDPIPPDPTEPTDASQDEITERTPFRMRLKQFFCRK